jgi:hypothetical protein
MQIPRKMFDLWWGKKLDTTMSFRATGLKRSLSVVLLVTGAGAVAALAQMAKPPLAALTAARIGQDYAQQQARVVQFFNEESVTTTLLQAPAVGSVSGGTSADNTNWLKVEWHYGVNPVDMKKNPWIDSVQFKVWVEGRDLYATNAPPGSQDGVAVCLTGSVTYLNLTQARDAYGVVYLHPSTLARYSGSGGAEDFERKFNVRVEAYVGGKLVDYQSKNPHDPSGPDWNKGLTPIPNFVLRQDQTPFLMADTTRYPMLKPMSTPDSGGSQ